MRNISDFFVRFAASVPGASVPAMADAVRRAAEEMCERARIWRGEDLIRLTGQTEYLCTDHCSVIHEIEEAIGDSGKLEPISISELCHQYDDWRSVTGQFPKYYTQTLPDTLQFFPVAETGNVTVRLWLKPAPRTSQLPDFLFNQYSRVIAEGALAILLMQPNTSYYNPELALLNRKTFEISLDRLNRQSVKGQQRAPVRSMASFF